MKTHSETECRSSHDLAPFIYSSNKIFKFFQLRQNEFEKTLNNCDSDALWYRWVSDYLSPKISRLISHTNQSGTCSVIVCVCVSPFLLNIQTPFMGVLCMSLVIIQLKMMKSVWFLTHFFDWYSTPILLELEASKPK